MQTIYLVRHGETEWNRAGRMQGRRDSPLTPHGEEQARRVGALLRDLIPTLDACAMVVSPSGRAVQTATIIAHSLGIDPARFAPDPMVQEFAWGEWESMTHAEIAAAAGQDVWQRFLADRWTEATPAGECYADVAERARQWLTAVAEVPELLLVSHGGFGRVLRGLYLGLSPTETLAQPVPQDAVFRLSDGVVSRFDAS